MALTAITKLSQVEPALQVAGCLCDQDDLPGRDTVQLKAAPGRLGGLSVLGRVPEVEAREVFGTFCNDLCCRDEVPKLIDDRARDLTTDGERHVDRGHGPFGDLDLAGAPVGPER